MNSEARIQNSGGGALGAHACGTLPYIFKAGSKRFKGIQGSRRKKIMGRHLRGGWVTGLAARSENVALPQLGSVSIQISGLNTIAYYNLFAPMLTYYNHFYPLVFFGRVAPAGWLRHGPSSRSDAVEECRAMFPPSSQPSPPNGGEGVRRTVEGERFNVHVYPCPFVAKKARGMLLLAQCTEK
jgi:hypothetical protein